MAPGEGLWQMRNVNRGRLQGEDVANSSSPASGIPLVSCVGLEGPRSSVRCIPHIRRAAKGSAETAVASAQYGRGLSGQIEVSKYWTSMCERATSDGTDTRRSVPGAGSLESYAFPESSARIPVDPGNADSVQPCRYFKYPTRLGVFAYITAWCRILG